MDSTLNMAPKGTLSIIPDTTGGNVNFTEAQQMLGAPESEMVSTQPSATLPDRGEGTPYTSVKVISERASNRQRLDNQIFLEESKEQGRQAKRMP